MVTQNSVNFYHNFGKFKDILNKFLNMKYELRKMRKKSTTKKGEKKMKTPPTRRK